MLSLTSFLSRSLMMSLTSFLSSTSQKKLEELETAEVTLSSEIATACSRMDELDKETEQILIELKDITVKRTLLGCSLYLHLTSAPALLVAFHVLLFLGPILLSKPQLTPCA